MTLATVPTLRTLPVRLNPGDDLRRALEAVVAREGATAAFVLSAIGSLDPAMVRLAGADDTLRIDGDTELLTLAGSIGGTRVDGGKAPSTSSTPSMSSHLHLSVADANGRVTGGHAAHGCKVRTTAEVLLVLLPDWHFAREHDAATGWAELSVRRAGP